MTLKRPRYSLAYSFGFLSALAVSLMLPITASGQGVGHIAEHSLLLANNASTAHEFGTAVGISGDTVVVGAPHEQSPSSGVNPPQGLSFFYTGAAYVYRRNGNSFVQEAFIKASNNTTAEIEFGQSVAISGDTIAVGAPSGDAGSFAGAVYILRRGTNGWEYEALLEGDNSEPGDRFGGSISLWRDTLVVGALHEDGGVSGVNGNGSDNSAPSAGAAYVFKRTGTTWNQVAYLKASNPDSGDQFGCSVSASGNSIVVGARNEASNAVGIDGNGSNNLSPNSGAAYAFHWDGANWLSDGYLKASNSAPVMFFGFDVAASGNRMVVGAPYEDNSATGVNGDQFLGNISSSGASYVFSKASGTWVQEAYVKASNTNQSARFGTKVALSGDTLAIAAPDDFAPGTGVNGNVNPNLSVIGAAYLLRYRNGKWVEDAFIKPDNPAPSQSPQALDLSPGWMTYGSPDRNSFTGSAYVYEIPDAAAIYCEPSAHNSAGTFGQLSVAGTIAVGPNATTLQVSGLPTQQSGYLLNSAGQDFVVGLPTTQGTLCLGGGSALGRHNRSHEIRSSGMTGSFELMLDLTDMPSATGPFVMLAGQTWNFQAWYRDQNPTNTSNFTNALTIAFE